MKPTQLRGAAFAAFHAGEWFTEYQHARRDAKETEGEARRTHIERALRCRRRYRDWLRQAIMTQGVTQTPWYNHALISASIAAEEARDAAWMSAAHQGRDA